MTNHTPTPEEIMSNLNERSWTVKETDIYNEIKRAVNSHEDLLKIAKAYKNLLKSTDSNESYAFAGKVISQAEV